MSPVHVHDKYLGNREVFSGWKDIAAYLGKGTRTVQRYERTLGLPVRRVGGKTRGSVLAMKAELDHWISSASVREFPEALEIATLRVAEDERQRLEKALARARKLQGETRGLSEQFSELRESFSRQMQIVRTSLALNDQRTRLYPDSTKSISPTCSICDWPVPLDSANTDEAGHAVHEECYVLKLKLLQTSKPKTTDIQNGSQNSPRKPRGHRAA